jgi:hypothetical protein
MIHDTVNTVTRFEARGIHRIPAVVLVSLLTGCFLFQHQYTYSRAEIEGVRRDTVFDAEVDEILIATRAALLDMGFQIERELKDLIITFPMPIDEEGFGDYAVERAYEGYEPVLADALYPGGSMEVHCVITPDEEGVKIRIKTLFQAFRKDIFYRASTDEDLQLGHDEIEGDFIECRSTGRTERALIERILDVLDTLYIDEYMDK